MSTDTYPQRWQRAIEEDRRVDVLVPVGSSNIAAGSGIVGSPASVEGMVVVDYEGNLHGAVNLRTWADRVHHAAGRHVVDYPTTARSVVLASQMVVVGSYRCATGDITVTNVDALRAWTGGELVEIGSDGRVRWDPF